MNTHTEPSLADLRSELVAGLTPKEVTADSHNEIPTAEGDESTKTPETTETKPKVETKPTDATKPKPEGEVKPEGETNETDFSKAKKDKERFRTNWGELQKEKAALKASQDALAADRLAIQQERDRITAERVKVAETTRKQSKYTPEQYEQLAKVLDEEGDTAKAQLARERAKELREAQTVEEQQQTTQRTEQMKQAVSDHWAKAQADFPEVKDEASPLRMKAVEVFKTVADELAKVGMVPAPSLHYLSVQHANALITAEKATAEATTLKEQVTKLEAEIKRLTKSTALPGSTPPGALPNKKDLASLSLADHGKALRAELDGG